MIYWQSKVELQDCGRYSSTTMTWFTIVSTSLMILKNWWAKLRPITCSCTRPWEVVIMFLFGCHTRLFYNKSSTLLYAAICSESLQSWAQRIHLSKHFLTRKLLRFFPNKSPLFKFAQVRSSRPSSCIIIGRTLTLQEKHTVLCSLCSDSNYVVLSCCCSWWIVVHTSSTNPTEARWVLKHVILSLISIVFFGLRGCSTVTSNPDIF